MHKVKNIYTIDFETRNSTLDLANKETSVWLWDICSCDTFKHRYGTTLDELFRFVFDEIKEDVIYYFHNLKFDGSFLISYLLTHGYTWSDKTFKEIQPYYFNSLIKVIWFTFIKSKKLLRFKYTIIIQLPNWPILQHSIVQEKRFVFGI